MKRAVHVAAVPAGPAPDGAPNPAPFPYHDYVAAKEALEAALKRGAFYGLVMGASGTGKTSLLRDLSDSLDRHQFQILYLSSPRVSLLSVVRYFAQVLRVTPKRSSLETIKAIADVVHTMPTRLVAWIDEAADLAPTTLAELRSLAEFKHDQPQILSIVFAGPPELKAQIDTPALFALKRRITTTCVLAGLRRDELDAFLVHRFGVQDAKRMPNGLRDDLFERTRAIPALIDRVFRHGLARSPRGIVSEDALREAFDVTGI